MTTTPPAPHAPGSRPPLPWVVRLAVAIVALPVLVDLALGGSPRAFGYVAADAFYYLVVARNVVDHGLISFDSTHLTNGFHPLWQGVCVTIVAAVRAAHMSDAASLTLAVVVGTLAGSLGVALWGRALHELLGRSSRAFLLLPIGLYALVLLIPWARFGAEVGRAYPVDGPDPLFGTCWSFANGMESGATFAAAGWMLLLYVRLAPTPPLGAALRFGLACALVMLARLDHALLVAPFLTRTVVRTWRGGDTRRVASIAALAGSVGAPLLAYLAINHHFFGSALPVSGAVKSTFPYPYAKNALSIGQALSASGVPAQWMPLAWRTLQLLVPLAAAAAYLAWPARRAQAQQLPGSDFGVPLAAGMLLLAAYDLAYVPLMQQGHWYFPVSVPAVTVLWILARGGAPSSAPRLSPALVAGALVGSCLFFLWTQRIPDHNGGFRTFYYRYAPELRRHYAGREPRLFSIDDGIVAFATGFPTMSGTGLMIDPEALPAVRQHRLGDLAVQRGYNRFTGLGYVDFRKLFHPDTDELSPDWVITTFGRKLSDPLAFRFALAYVSSDRAFGLLKVQAADAAAAAHFTGGASAPERNPPNR